MGNSNSDVGNTLSNAFNPATNGLNDSLAKTNSAAASTLNPATNGLNDSLAKTNSAAASTLNPATNGLNASIAKTNSAAANSLNPATNGLNASIAKTNAAAYSTLDPTQNGFNSSVAKTNDAALAVLDPARNGLAASAAATFSGNNVRDIRASFTDTSGIGNNLVKTLTFGMIDPSQISGTSQIPVSTTSTLDSGSYVPPATVDPSSSQYTDKSADTNATSLSSVQPQVLYGSTTTTMPSSGTGYSSGNLITGIIIAGIIAAILARRNIKV